MKNLSPLSCASIAVFFCSVFQVNGALISSDLFDYDGGQTLTAVTENGGTGWGNAWQQGAGTSPGISMSGSNQSLYFDQAPALVTDGSNHIFKTGNSSNNRDFSAGVSANSTYFTLLVRSFLDGEQTGGGVQMRVGFFDGLDASGNMRANVGIDGTALFVSAASDGYSPGSSSSEVGLFADDTTYLLAMKRTGSGISAALIEANGDLSSLTAEPTWQVTHSGSTGVTFQSMRLIINGTNTGLRADELRVATTWGDAVDGLVAIPEPGTYALFLSLACGGLIIGRRAVRARRLTGA